MRKNFISVIILILAISAGAYYVLYRPFSVRIAMETVLPGDTLAVMRVCDLSGQLERFRAGRMGQALGGMDWPNLLAAMGVPEQDRVVAMAAMANAGAAVESLWFHVLFGQDISLAVLKTGLDPDRLAAGGTASLREAVVAVSRPTQPALVLESLGSMVGGQLSATTRTYGQWEIIEVALEGGTPLYYALTDGLMITGLSPTPVESCLRQSLDPKTSLLSTEGYNRHCAKLYDAESTTLLAFADVETLLPLAREAMEKNAAADAHIRQLENLRGLESLNVVQYDDGGGQVTYRTILGLDRADMTPHLSRMLATAPGPNATFERMPADALLYGWQNTFDLSLYWEYLKSDPAMTPEAFAQIERSVTEKTGAAPDTLLGAFGTQAGIVLKDIDTVGFFPVPKLALFVEAARPEVVAGLLRRQMERTGMPVSRERHGDVDIEYLSLPLGEGLSPAYAFSDGFCTLATSRTLLKSLLDAPESGGLKAHPHILALGDSVTSESNSVFYLRADGLVEKSRDLISTAMAWVAMTKPGTGEILSLGISPLLDGLSMIEAVGGHTVIEEERVVTEVKVLLDRSQDKRM